MSRGFRFVVLLSVLSAAWLLIRAQPHLLAQALPKPYVAPATQIVETLPLWLLVTFGSYSLASIGHALLTFRDCPEAAKELEREIADARDRLRQRGYKFDQ